jgi:hypothetical protein
LDVFVICPWEIPASPRISLNRRERNISFIKRQTRRMTTVVGECGSNGDKKKRNPLTSLLGNIQTNFIEQLDVGDISGQF